MLDKFASPLSSALIIFPFLALAITAPFLIAQYRKYGAVPFFRALAVYCFVFYLLCAYFLVILPLPGLEEVRGYTGPWANLIPFSYVGEFVAKTEFRILEPDTWGAAFRNMILLEPLFNIVLTLPFGLFLRYYYRCGRTKTVLLSLALSLFFELTQLSGLYGIYPRPYRLFDVNDLMGNTLGGLAGWYLEPLFAKLVPSRAEIDAAAYRKGEEVSYFRRLAALAIDGLASLSLILMVTILVPADQIGILLAAEAFLYVLVPYLWKGQTLGKAAVKIRLARLADRSRPGLGGLLLRFVILRAWLLDGLALLAFMSSGDAEWLNILAAAVIGAWLVSWLILLADLIRNAPKKDRALLYEKWSGLINVSSIKV